MNRWLTPTDLTPEDAGCAVLKRLIVPFRLAYRTRKGVVLDLVGLTPAYPPAVLTDEEAADIRKKLDEGWRGPVLLTELHRHHHVAALIR
jgi:hypothetical protein